MEIKRAILYVIIALLAIAIFDSWTRDYPVTFKKNLRSEVAVELKNKKTSIDYIPSAFSSSTKKLIKNNVCNISKRKTYKESKKDDLVTIKTDVLKLVIDSQRGDIVSAKLIKYLGSAREKQKQKAIQILSSDIRCLYVAQSNLMDLKGKIPCHYTVKRNLYQLTNKQNRLVIRLTNRAFDGLYIIKTYTFYRNSYAAQIAYQIYNSSNKPWKGNIYTQISRREPKITHHHFYVRNYSGAAISSPQTLYEKVTYRMMDKKDYNCAIKGGWIAMQQRYFLSAWIPNDSGLAYRYYSHVIPLVGTDNIYVIGFVSPQMCIASNKIVNSHITFYVGPEVVSRLKTLAPGLDRTVDYGWLWPISDLLFRIMNAIHVIVKNWGWTIVLTTTFIKIAFYWFSAKSFRSMIRIHEIRPRLQALKERYGNDRKSLSQATIELYRKEKINPLGGYLPMLIQIPVFIAFYYVIMESIELRQAPFIFWIHDLSIKDPYYILPVLMGLSMILQQRFSLVSPDPTPQKIIWIFPVVFTLFFINFPSGLVLYWLVNNCIQTLQQWFIYSTYLNQKNREKLKISCERKK
ncbi:membrane protein insertase YidC [Coxiella endosymbiont of Amblyomma americanum]|uniref:membrane protein insertase YidC n=1 Tax=Coxiella endosymbiont of Amblyomma americanum TaxID=325775 RepID=UPI00057ED002|nr:membrane protein insertase YidC [Coxiella endosymbiont of Amblyomma americanum]AJC50154.1 membrane protein [Coxiella endosymbiont of Amblyomma americanum]AUJ58515.1 membrane protein insertase YidC [Coxiella-like endosymbiont of Amblyomma americanum]